MTDGVERLTAQDVRSLWPDDRGWPQDIGAIAILDGAALLDRNGRFRIDYARRAVADRLPRLRRFRQVVLVPPLGLGWPLWADAQVVDLANHVRALALPPHANEQEILAAVERLRRQPLDRSRPLWEMWFLTGLAGGRVVLFLRAHHAIADGVAGIAMLQALLDTQPAPPTFTPAGWSPRPVPTRRDLLLDNVRRKLRGLATALSTVAHIRGRLRAAWPALSEVFATGSTPRTSLNRPIGPGRRLALVRSEFDLVRQAAHDHGATVNDVLMAAMAGGLRSLMDARGEATDGVVLRAYVPVALHREQRRGPDGNDDALMIIGLPVGIADTATRLQLIAAETAERRKLSRPSGGAVMPFPALQRMLLGLMTNQRWANVYAANVPGPPVRLHFGEAPVIELFPVVPLIGNVTLGVGALSYAGRFTITAVADEQACPDLDVFAAGMRASLDTLTRLSTVSG